MSVWLVCALMAASFVALSVPVGYYLALVMDGRSPRPGWLRALESSFDTGPQDWKGYALALLAFHAVLFVFGFAVLVAQPWLPFDEGRPALAPTTIFHSVCSFLTNTNQQHYAGEVHLTYSTQILFVLFNMFVTPAVGLCAVVAVIRGLRGDENVGNFYVDLWRGLAYVLLPSSLLVGLFLVVAGVPMTFEPPAEAVTVEGGKQTIARGPVAAVLPIKHLGTNGGGFFAANSAHPYENPTSWTNYVEMTNIAVLPLGVVVMFGVMLRRLRDAALIYGAMLVLFGLMLAAVIAFDAGRANEGFRGRDAGVLTALPPLPVDSEGVGNLEGKELRFGPAGSSLFVVTTTAIACGSVNCAHDSLNPLAGLAPLTGMWLNCVFGGKGVGMINLLLYLITAVFLSGLMVGRTPEYLGKKVEAREMKLAMLALLVHPILSLGPTGLFAPLDWGNKAVSNPGAHGFTQILYEFTSASANNGSGFEGLKDTWGFNHPRKDDPEPAPTSVPWDVGCGVTMLLGRFLPIIAPLALAGGLARKRRVPFTVGTLRTDTVTFGFVLLGTILLVGALLFLPAAMLGPVAEHLGPIPFGG